MIVHFALNDPRKALCGEYIGVYADPDKTTARRGKVTCERCIAEIVAAQMAPRKYEFPWSVDPVFPVSRGED